MFLLYSDVEAPDSVPFKDSMYNENDAVVDAQGMVLPAGYDLRHHHCPNGRCLRLV